MKKSTVIAFVSLVVIVAIIMIGFASVDRDSELVGENIPINNELEYSFKYPDVATSTYVTLMDWPPLLRVVDGPLDCVEAGTPEERTGQTQSKTIDGRDFCVTEVAEGAAGSVYYQYAYATEMNDATFIYTFSARMPQCQNYDEPQRDDCVDEQENFSPDSIAVILANNTTPQFP